MFRHRSGLNYLEFVNVGNGGKKVNKPGVSLRYEGKLKDYFESTKRQRGLKAQYIHKNYDWKKDAKSALPGWNFVAFRRPVFKSIYPWFTEYEPRPGKKRTQPKLHPNTAQYISGMELVVRGTDRPKLEKIFGRNFGQKDVSLGDFSLYVNSGNSTRISALVVKCASLDRFIKVAKTGKKVFWREKNAVLIKNPAPGMWDIVVVDK
jgi:hypothetical protein